MPEPIHKPLPEIDTARLRPALRDRTKRTAPATVTSPPPKAK